MWANKHNLPKNYFKYSIAVTKEDVSFWTPIVFRGDIFQSIDKAKQIGYDAVELHLRNPKEIDADRLKKYCDFNNFNISALGTGLESSLNKLSLIDDDEMVRHKTIERLKEHIDLAMKLGCSVIIGCIRGNIPHYKEYEKYEKYLISALTQLVDYAEKKRVILFLEAINRYVNNYLNTVKQTTDFVNNLGSSMLKVHIDTHHMNIEEVDLRESIKYCGDKLGYVHISDSNLRYPGAGHIDFISVMQALKDVGYSGYISLECLPYPDAYIVAEKSLNFIKSIEQLTII